MIRVLLCAPRTDLLLVDAEVQDIVASQLDVVLMIGDVSSVDLTRKINEDEFDVLWLATHGTNDGITLSDGLMDVGTLTQIIRGRFHLIILNTCKSYEAAQTICDETDATVICTIRDVPDKEAYHTASLLAYALARTGDARTAYDQSKPGRNRTYLYLAGKKKWRWHNQNRAKSK